MKKVISLLILIFIALLVGAPLVFLLSGTLMGTQEIRQYTGPVLYDEPGFAVWRLIPLYPTLQNLVELLLDSPEFFPMFWNSIKMTAGVLFGQLVFGVPSAWGLARYSFPGKKQVYLLYIVLMMLPFQVTMLSQYLVLDKLGILDHPSAIILPGIFSTFPVFIMYRFFSSIPEVLLESARVDGAAEWQIFGHIGIPTGSSGIISALMLQFLEFYSLIEQPLTFLKTKSLWPLSLYLPEIDQSKAGLAFCVSFMTLLPALLVFLAGQDYLEQGIVASAIKE